MLVIRLSRTGRKKQPNYRLVVTEKSAPIKGRFVERLGHYNPRTKELVIDKDRAKIRLDAGAQPSDTAEALLEKAGVLKRGKIVQRPTREKKKKAEAAAPAEAKPEAKGDDATTEEAPADKADVQAEDAPKAETKTDAKADDAKPEAKDEAKNEPQAQGDNKPEPDKQPDESEQPVTEVKSEAPVEKTKEPAKSDDSAEKK